MFKNIYLDHSYNCDQNFKFFKKLGKLGFVLEKTMMEHPGKAYCKFIMLSGSKKSQGYYLEFISFGKGAPAIEREAGLSFGYHENLEKLFNKIKSKLSAKFVHKNYDWKNNSVDRLPGWNMLTFKKRPIQNTFTWFTEYEPVKRKKKIEKILKHKNTVEGLHGIVLSLTPKSKKNLEIILGKKIKDKVELNDGTFIYLEKGKSDRYKSIILNAQSLKKVKKVVGRSGKSEMFFDHEVVRIDPPLYEKSLSWNLLIRES
nr:hypothetical protein BHI3_08650 [Bacteriovorax sp. HI3]